MLIFYGEAESGPRTSHSNSCGCPVQNLDPTLPNFDSEMFKKNNFWTNSFGKEQLLLDPLCWLGGNTVLDGGLISMTASSM